MPAPESKKAFVKVFDRFDADKSGYLDVAEVKEAFRILTGAEIANQDYEDLMKKFDFDHNGSIDFDEFLILVNQLDSKEYVEPEVEPYKGSCLGKDKKLPFQDEVLRIYTNKIVAAFVGLCIIGNFFVNILEKQIDPDISNMQHETLWAQFDVTFNIIFAIELVANMYSYGGPVRSFWASGWNVFDTIIVVVGVLTMANVLGPPLDKLKLMRAFRVFRLFKRVESLNKIIVALLKSIPGVLNAFVVMVVFFCIYAILAVELFREFGEGGDYQTYDYTTESEANIDSVTLRGYVHGIEYYGTFMRALYTLFQVMTGESWSEAVVRPLLFGWSRDHAIVPGVFFVTFILMTNLVLMNVVVAVLLENFVTDDGAEDTVVDARLADLDLKEATWGMNAKLDRLTENMEQQQQLSKDVASLTDAVADLRAELKAIREDRSGEFPGKPEIREEKIREEKAQDYSIDRLQKVPFGL